MSVQHAMRVENTASRSPGASLRRRRNGRLISTLVAVPALLTMAACSGSAPAAPSQPTVQAVATQAVGVAATAQVAASPVVATAQAAASPAMATAQAGAAPVTATSASLVGTAVGAVAAAASPSPSPSPAAQRQLRIADASLSDSTPWLSIKNDGAAPVDVSGWSLQVGTASTEIPESAVVEPGGTLTLRAGSGTNSEDELYLGNAGTALASVAQPGMPVRLTDPSGQVMAEVAVPRL